MKPKVHLIVFITGLLSSLPFFNWFFSRWAKKLQASLVRLLPKSLTYQIMIVSADGKGEAEAFERIMALHRQGQLGKLVIVGHSNGFRDGLIIANDIEEFGVDVDYFAGIDMTLMPLSAFVSMNILRFDEFHAVYKRAEFAKGYPIKERATYKRVRKGHTAAASDEEVQETILKNIISLLTRA